MRVSVIGNTSRHIGAAVAADLALAGHDVRMAVFPDGAAGLEKVAEQGGFHVEGDPQKLVSGRIGFARLKEFSGDPRSAVADAEVVILDIPMQQLPARFAEIAPNLARNAVVHAQTYGCWAASLLTTVLKEAGRNDVLAAECKGPTIAAKYSGGTVTTGILRRGLEVATVPSNRTDEALSKLRHLFPDLTRAASVMETSMGNINLMVHPAMSLLGVALFERAEASKETIRFYVDANVPSAGALADGLDRERAAVCAAYGVSGKSLPETLKSTYNATGDGSYEAVANCAPYQNALPFPASIWRDWMADDLAFGMVPIVLLGEQAGIPVRLHRSVIHIFEAILGIDAWSSISLRSLGLEGDAQQVAVRMTGKAA